MTKSNNDTAHTALRSGEVQVVEQADQQSGRAVPAKVVNLTSCIAAATTDTGALQAGKAKFEP